MTAFTKSHLDNIEQYELRKIDNIRQLIRLDLNENPYSLIEPVRKELELVEAREYLHVTETEILDLLQNYTGFQTENIAIGNGSDDLINSLCTAVLSPKDAVAVFPPTFTIYKFVAEVHQAEVHEIYRSSEDWQAPAQKVSKLSKLRTKIAFFCSPNNPTGNLENENLIISALKQDLIVVVDETYHEFAKQSYSNLLKKYSNLVILRSFSKWASMAGLRFGYLIADAHIVKTLKKVQLPFNVNSAAINCAIRSLRNLEEINERNRQSLKNLFVVASELKVKDISVYNSSANFVLCKFDNTETAEKFYKYLLENKILVKRYSKLPLDRHVRISMCKTEDLNYILDVIRNFNAEE